MELNYKVFGQGDPVIILHGLFGMLDNWQGIANRLAEHFTVFILDQRNHGNSPKMPTHDYPSMAEDLRQFMENHWMYSAHIIGHSMGGKVAMRFALDHPDMVEKLVVVDIAPKEYHERHNHIFDALFSLDLENLKDRKEAETHLVNYISDVGERLFMMKNLTRKTPLRGQGVGGFELKMNLPVLQEHYDEITASVQSEEPFEKETLFIRGGNSAYIGEQDIPGIKKLFPASQIVTVEGAGHWVHADRPEELLKLVKDFLRSE